MGLKLLFALAGVTLAISVGSVAAAPRGVGDAATLRSDPGQRWPFIALIPAEARVDVLNCGPGWENDWRHVRYENKTGYLHAGAGSFCFRKQRHCRAVRHRRHGVCAFRPRAEKAGDRAYARGNGGEFLGLRAGLGDQLAPRGYRRQARLRQ